MSAAEGEKMSKVKPLEWKGGKSRTPFGAYWIRATFRGEYSLSSEICGLM